jgi:hypothetical protein
LAAVAYIFVTLMYLRSKKNFWHYLGTGAGGDAAVARALARLLPVLPNKIPTENQ